MKKTAKTILAAINKSNGCINSAILTYVTTYKLATIHRTCAMLLLANYIINEPTCDGNTCYYITEDGKACL